MAKMKKKQQNEKLYCPYCGGLAVLRPAEYVYGERNLNPDNYLYVCSGYPSCDSYIGVHKKSMRPMGTLANGDLRHKRIEAHRALNKVVQAGIMTKHGAYIWLQNRLCLREKDMHIGMFRWNVPGKTRIIGTKNQEVWNLRKPNIEVCIVAGMIACYVIPKLLEVMKLH